MILVTGATGNVGREVARQLGGRETVRVMARDPGRVTVTGPGVEVVQGSYDDRDSLRGALRGVRSAFLVTNDPSRNHDAAFVEESQVAGVRRVVKLSAAAVADPSATDLITTWQRANERLVRESGLEWTVLRPRSFMSNALSWGAGIRSSGEVRALYGQSLNACVDTRDIAEVAALALTDDGHHGRTYPLTGPEALSAQEQTARLARVLGRPLRFVELEPEQAREHLLSHYPGPIADALLESARRQRDGGKAVVERTQEELLGRPAGCFDAWAAGHAEAFS